MVANTHVISQFIKRGQEFRVEKGEIISATVSQEPIEYIDFLAQGIAALSSPTPNGQMITYKYFMQPDFVNIIPLLSRELIHYENQITVLVEAKTSCLCYRFTAAQIFEKMAEPSFKDEIMKTILRDYTDAMEKQRDDGEDSTKINLCRFIGQHATRDAQGDYYLDDIFTYAELANYFHVHEVTIARLIQQLKADKLIERKHGKLYLSDRKRIRLLVE